MDTLEWILPALNILVLVLIFSVAKGPSGFPSFFSVKQMFSQGTTVVLFHSSKCGHCIALKDASKGGKWPMFLVRAKNAGITVKEVQMDAPLSSSDQALVAKAGPMPGVPFIVKMSGGGDMHTYSGPRTDDALMSWGLGV